MSSRYVFPTGEGYLTTLRESAGIVRVSLGTVRVRWEAGDVVSAEVRGREAAITGEPVDDPAAEYLVRDGPDGAGRVSIKSEVLDPLGVGDGDQVRVYQETPDTLVVVARDDDPRAPSGGAEPSRTARRSGDR